MEGPRGRAAAARFRAYRQTRRAVPLFWPLLADALQRTAGDMMFDEIVGALREISAEDLKANIVSGIFHDASIPPFAASNTREFP